MRRFWFPDFQKANPYRRPTWRWDRAHWLIARGKYMSKKRDDQPTGIAVEFIREINRCLSHVRLRRVRARFQYVAQAHDIWQAARAARLEVESRILARQTDAAVGLAMGLPPQCVQAYRDIFYHLDDRIDSGSYIMREVIGWPPVGPPTPRALVQAAAYHHGPAVVESGMAWLRDQDATRDLTSHAGRTAAAFDLLLAVHSLPNDAETRWSMLKRLPFLLENRWKFANSRPAARAFRDSTAKMMGQLGLSVQKLPPISYAPVTKSKPVSGPEHQTREAA